MKKIIKIFLVLILLLSSSYHVKASTYFDNKVGTYEEELSKFPIEYQEKIKKLHEIYPNAIFVKQDKFFSYKDTKHPEKSYKEVDVLWDDMLQAEYGDASLIYYTAQADYKQDNFNKEKTWYYASKKAIEYYMNPYNFLDEKHVFMFQSQYYNESETEEGINGILTDYYKSKECPGSEGKTYAQVIIEAAKENNISAYMLASRLRQENGPGTSPLVTGKCLNDEENCTKYYNLYNIQATGSVDSEVISNGIKCASGQLVSSKNTKLCDGYSWTSPYLSIKGGAKFIYDKYIGVNDRYNVKGQMTNYLQKWDPYGPNLSGHQYMQNIQAPYYESETTYKSNMQYIGKDFKYIFYIPIFKDAPNTGDSDISKLISTKYTLNDKYISGIKINKKHEEVINEIKSLNANIEVNIEKNSNNSTDKIATGDKIKITYQGNTTTYEAIIYGDVNGDSNISATDYVKIKLHIMGSNVLEGAYKKAADVNKDNDIKATDYVKIKLHIMGTSLIS